MKINKKETREIVLDGLNNGKSKDEIYEEIFSKYNDYSLQNDIAGIVQYVPDKKRLKKYGIFNYLFLGLLIIIDLYTIIDLNFQGFALFALMTWLVATVRVKHYSWFIVLGAIMAISAVGMALFGYLDPGRNLLTFFGGFGALAALFVLFGIYMPRLLTPDYIIVEETVTSSEGAEIKRKRIHFS